MTMNPDEIFRKMDAHRPVMNRRKETPQPQKETVYIPRTTHDGTYRLLMRSHDRTGTRHLQ